MRSLFVPFCLALLASACSSTPVVVPTKNLDRPVDMSFVCLAVNGTTGQLSGQPMSTCHQRDAVDPSTTGSNGQRVLGTFAFVPNSGIGQVAVADIDQGKLLDLTPYEPGYGQVTVGENPQSISASQDGCWVVTGNRSSCDFSLIDPSRLLIGTFNTSSSPVTPSSSVSSDGSSSNVSDSVHRLAIVTGSNKPLLATVGEVAFLPSSLSGASCGNPDLATAQPPTVVATFPSCDMVAILNLSFTDSTATIADAYYVRPDLPGGFAPAGTEPVCPTDCATSSGASVDGGAAVDANVDSGSGTAAASASNDGGTSSSSFQLQALTVYPDGMKIVVASLLDDAVTFFDLNGSSLQNPTRFQLAESPGGVTRVRLSVDPFAGTAGNPPGVFMSTLGSNDVASFADSGRHGRGDFLYAFTRDDSIRVVKIDGATPVECDVNVLPYADSLPANAGYQKNQSCFPVGTGIRRASAKGPGIRIPTFSNPDNSPPIPRDLTFADLQPASTNTNYHSLSGQFGFVVSSSGQVYIVNLAPNGEDSTTATHSFRESRDVGKTARTALAISISPQRTAVQSDQAFATTANFSAQDGPLFKTFLVIDSSGTKTYPPFDYPDPDYIVSRSWTVTWEGILPQTARESGIIQADNSNPPQTAGRLKDSSADFCASGVQSGDVLMFTGCTQDSDCQPDDAFSCQVAVSGARGMCLPKDSAKTARIINDCSRFMGSRMRYEVAQAGPTGLTLRVKIDEVPKTSLNPCVQDSDCRPDVEHGSFLAAGAATDAGINRGFQCLQIHADDPRCVKKCTDDSDCRAGHVCESVPGVLPEIGKLCVEAPPISNTECFPQPMTSYSVRAGHSFLVTGSSFPTLMHNARASATGTCEPDPSANTVMVSRIPLSAPRCPDAFLASAAAAGKYVQELNVQNSVYQPGGNPCLYLGSWNDGDATSSSTSGAIDAGASDSERIRAFYQNSQIRFVMTNLDTYVGDLFAIHFEFQYGFIPLTVQIPSYEVLLTMGTALVTGPTKTPESPIRSSPPPVDTSYPYLYLVDQGRTALTSGSRGQVLRINPRLGSNEIASFDSTISGSTPFQLQ